MVYYLSIDIGVKEITIWSVAGSSASIFEITIGTLMLCYNFLNKLEKYGLFIACISFHAFIEYALSLSIGFFSYYMILVNALILL
jgi:hypothetical protein